MLAALVAEQAGIGQLVIAGDADAGGSELRQAAAEFYRPFLVELPLPSAHRDVLVAQVPQLAGMTAVDGRAAAYLCADFVCRSPVTAPGALRDAAAGLEIISYWEGVMHDPDQAVVAVARLVGRVPCQ